MSRKVLTPEEREQKRKERNRKLFEKYKTFEGDEKGNPDQWREAFLKRMEGGSVNIEENLQLLGLETMPNSENDLKKAYREAMKKSHPDKGGSDDLAAKINEAFEALKERFKGGSES